MTVNRDLGGRNVTADRERERLPVGRIDEDRRRRAGRHHVDPVQNQGTVQGISDVYGTVSRRRADRPSRSCDGVCRERDGASREPCAPAARGTGAGRANQLERSVRDHVGDHEGAVGAGIARAGNGHHATVGQAGGAGSADDDGRGSCAGAVGDGAGRKTVVIDDRIHGNRPGCHGLALPSATDRDTDGLHNHPTAIDHEFRIGPRQHHDISVPVDFPSRIVGAGLIALGAAAGVPGVFRGIADAIVTWLCRIDIHHASGDHRSRSGDDPRRAVVVNFRLGIGNPDHGIGGGGRRGNEADVLMVGVDGHRVAGHRRTGREADFGLVMDRHQRFGRRT